MTAVIKVVCLVSLHAISLIKRWMQYKCLQCLVENKNAVKLGMASFMMDLFLLIHTSGEIKIAVNLGEIKLL